MRRDWKREDKGHTKKTMVKRRPAAIRTEKRKSHSGRANARGRVPECEDGRARAMRSGVSRRGECEGGRIRTCATQDRVRVCGGGSRVLRGNRRGDLVVDGGECVGSRGRRTLRARGTDTGRQGGRTILVPLLSSSVAATILRACRCSGGTGTPPHSTPVPFFALVLVAASPFSSGGQGGRGGRRRPES